MAKVRDYFQNVVLPYYSDECLHWPFAKDTSGYGRMRMGERLVSVHRLVCEAQHGPASTPKHEAAHSCGNSSCCNAKHLSWKTRAENEADKVVHGTAPRGERQGSSKLAEADVREIIALSGKLSQREIADRFSVSQGNVHLIHQRKRWGWLDAR